MNLQEFRALAIMLQRNAVESGQSGLERLARKIEDGIVINATGILDAAVIKSFSDSKNAENRYLISSAEPPIIQNAKAMINLLRSLDQIPPHVISTLLTTSANLAEAFLNAETDFQLSSIAKILGQTAIDVSLDVLQDPGKQVNNAAVTLWEQRTTLAKLAPAAAKLGLNTLVATADVYTDPAKYVNSLASWAWGNRTTLMNAAQHPVSSIANAAANIAESQKQKYLSDIIQDYNVYKLQVGQLVGTIQEMSDSTGPASAKLKSLSRVLVDNDLFKLHVTFTSGIKDLNEGRKAEAETISHGFQAKAKGMIINPLQSFTTELTSSQRLIIATLEEIKTVANGKLKDLNAYKLGYNEKTKLYEIDSYPDLTHEQIQLMKIANISTEMAALSERIMRAQNDGVKFRDLTNIEEYMNNIGVIWKELQGIDPRILSGSFADEGIKQIYDALIAPVKELIILTLKTETKMGLSKDILLPNLENVSRQMNNFAKANNLPVMSGYPFAEERKIALARNMIELQDKYKIIEAAVDYIKANPIKEPGPVLLQILKTIEQLKLIPTLAASEYMNHLVMLKNEITGLNKLDDAIKKAESEMFLMDEKVKRGGATPLALKELSAKMEDIKQLYLRRDTLMESLEKVDQWKDDCTVRGNKYYHADEAIYLSEQFTADKLTAANNLGSIVAGELISVRADFNNESDRLKEQFSILGGNAVDYVERERKRIEASDKKDGNEPARLKENKATKLDVKQMDRIDKLVKRKNEAEYVAKLSKGIADIDRSGGEKYRENLRQEIMAGIRDKYGGSNITYFREKRTDFLKMMRGMLADKQRELISESKKDSGGLYQPDASDTALVRNIKNINNVMIRFENLMDLYVKFQAISAAGYGNKELLGILAPLRDNINGLVKELKTTANDIRILGALSINVIGEAAVNILSDILPFVDQIPVVVSAVSNKLNGISSVFDIRSMTSIDELPKQNLAKALQLTKSLVDGIPSPLEISSKALPEINLDMKALLGGAVTKLCQNSTKAAYALLEKTGIHPEKNGTYNLKKLPAHSIEFGIALLHNQSIAMRKALDACTEVSAGKTISGKITLAGLAISSVLDYVKNYKKVMKETLIKYKSVAGEVGDRLMADFEAIKPEISKLLGQIYPVLNSILSQADMLELTLGLKTGVLTQSFISNLELLDNLINTYGSVIANTTNNKLQFSAASELAMVKSQLAMLQNLKEDPTQNQSLINNQIKQAETAIRAIENKVKLKSAGVAATNLGKHGVEAERRAKEKAAFINAEPEKKGVSSQSRRSTVEVRDKHDQPVPESTTNRRMK